MRIVSLLLSAMLLATAGAQQGLWPDVVLNGRIITVLHEGVPAAKVWVTDANDQEVARTVADGDGYYQLRKLPAGTLYLHANGQGFITHSMQVNGEGFVRAATLTLQDAAPIRGTVSWPDGSPAKAAEVIVYTSSDYPDDRRWVEQTTCTDAGTWQLPAAPLGDLIVRAYVSGFELGECKIAADRTKPATLVMPNKPLAPRLVNVADVPEGVVCSVRCQPPGVHRRPYLLLPRGAGEFAINAEGVATTFALAAHSEVRVHAPGYRSMPIAVRSIPGSTEPMQFRLSPLPKEVVAPSTAIKGLVVDELGAPLANITVLTMGQQFRGEPVTSAQDGTFAVNAPASEGVLFRIGLLSPKWRLGDQRLELGADGITWQSVAASPDAVVRLHATRAGTVRGTLLGPTGTPLAAAEVRMQTRNNRSRHVHVLSATDAAGRITIAGLPVGAYTLTATAADGRVGSTNVDVVATEEVEPGQLSFVAGFEVTGRVINKAGEPIAAAMLQFSKADPRIPRQMQRRFLGKSGQHLTTDRLGRFRLPVVGEGDWLVFELPTEQQPQPRYVDTLIVTDKPIRVDFTIDN
jgi:hypothetical protein